jgi:hypothetical protein
MGGIMLKHVFRIFILSATFISHVLGQNQTEVLSPIFPEDSLPFTIQIDVADFALPTGIQSFIGASRHGKWLLIAGRINGLHGFDNIVNNFPPQYQNTEVLVVDPKTGTTWTKSLSDPSSELSQEEIDALSVTAAQGFQKGNILYLVGGYGIHSASGEMETKSTLTRIHIDRMMDWVIEGKGSARRAIKQTSDPLLQVTGGFLFQEHDHQPFLLMLGQNFSGLYRDSSNGQYTCQIRPFWINENGNVYILPHESSKKNPDYRRRDLNIVPILHRDKEAYVAFSGVFTLDSGVWTVPITIYPDGSSFEPDPNDSDTFKQAMNNYDCPAFGLYSTKKKEMFVIFPGGISFGYFSGGIFQTDSEIPFINQVTTIKIDKNKVFTQYLMDNEYPYLVSTGANPGNQLLFGAEAEFFPKDDISLFRNGVIQLDKLHKPTVVGYIVGGIMSTLPNTNADSDSTASPYVFTVTIIPKNS